jgi:hypothetical protein
MNIEFTREMADIILLMRGDAGLKIKVRGRGERLRAWLNAPSNRWTYLSSRNVRQLITLKLMTKEDTRSSLNSYALSYLGKQIVIPDPTTLEGDPLTIDE